MLECRCMSHPPRKEMIVLIFNPVLYLHCKIIHSMAHPALIRTTSSRKNHNVNKAFLKKLRMHERNSKTKTPYISPHHIHALPSNPHRTNNQSPKVPVCRNHHSPSCSSWMLRICPTHATASTHKNHTMRFPMISKYMAFCIHCNLYHWWLISPSQTDPDWAQLGHRPSDKAALAAVLKVWGFTLVRPVVPENSQIWGMAVGRSNKMLMGCCVSYGSNNTDTDTCFFS